MESFFYEVSVANMVSEHALKEKRDLTSLKLEQVLFFLQGYYLKQYGERLINSVFQNGQYFPYLTNLREYFRENESQPLFEPAFSFDSQKLEIVKIPSLNMSNIGQERFKELQEMTKKLLAIQTYQLANYIAFFKSDFEIGRCFSDEQVRLCYLTTFE